MKWINADRLKRIGAWLLPHTAIVLALFALFIAITFLINLFVVSPQIASAMTAAGTLTLAIAAFMTIWSSNRLEKRRRKAELLDEIINWAEVLDEVVAGSAFDFNSVDTYATNRELLRLRTQMRNIVKKSQGIENDTLLSLVKKVRRDMDAYVQQKGGTSKKLRSSIWKLIDKSLDIKIKQLR